MSFWQTFGNVEDQLHKVDPFYQAGKLITPYLPDVLTPADTKFREHERTITNNVHTKPVNPQPPEQPQADKINNFIEHNKVIISGSFALLIIFLMLR